MGLGSAEKAKRSSKNNYSPQEKEKKQEDFNRAQSNVRQDLKNKAADKKKRVKTLAKIVKRTQPQPRTNPSTSPNEQTKINNPPEAVRIQQDVKVSNNYNGYSDSEKVQKARKEAVDRDREIYGLRGSTAATPFLTAGGLALMEMGAGAAVPAAGAVGVAAAAMTTVLATIGVAVPVGIATYAFCMKPRPQGEETVRVIGPADVALK
ncbi:MAG: hypothetical protein V4691_02550 [Pseudomonadota bacterium]